MVRISAFHAGGPGSIPGVGNTLFGTTFSQRNSHLLATQLTQPSTVIDIVHQATLLTHFCTTFWTRIACVEDITERGVASSANGRGCWWRALFEIGHFFSQLSKRFAGVSFSLCLVTKLVKLTENVTDVCFGGFHPAGEH